MLPLFLYNSINVLFLHSLGILLLCQILLNKFVNYLTPTSSRHFQTSMEITSGPTAFLVFIRRNISLTSQGLLPGNNLAIIAHLSLLSGSKMQRVA